MAHVTKYGTTFYSIRGDKVEVRILQDGYYGAVLPIKLMTDNPVVIEQRTKDNIIYGTGCTLQIKSDTLLQYLDIVNSPEWTHVIEVDVNDANYFRGYVNPELYEEAFNGNLFRAVIIRAACGLSALENKYLTFGSLEEKTLYEWIIECLEATGLAYSFTAWNCELTEIQNTYGINYLMFKNNSALSDNFLEDGQPISCKDILIKILGAFNCSIVCEDNQYYIERHRDRRNKTTGERRRVFNAYGISFALGAIETTPVHELTQDVVLIETGQALRLEAGKKIVACNRKQLNIDNLIRLSGVFTPTPIAPLAYSNTVAMYEWLLSSQVAIESAADGAMEMTVASAILGGDGLTTRFKAYMGEATRPRVRVSMKAKSPALGVYNSNKYISVGIVLKVMNQSIKYYYWHDNSNNRELTKTWDGNVLENLYIPYSTISQLYDQSNPPEGVDGYYDFSVDYDFDGMFADGFENSLCEFQLTIKPLHYRQGEPVDNDDSPIAGSVMGDYCASGFIKDLKVEVEVDDLHNYFEAESEEGYRDKEEFDLYLHDAENVNIASGVIAADGSPTTLWKQAGAGAGADMTKWFLHDKFQQYYKPRFMIDCAVKKTGIIHFMDMIHDPKLDKLYYMTSRLWNLKMGSHKVKLEEYINTDPDLTDL